METPNTKARGANFSTDRNYRYLLWRVWDENLPKIMFIGLNPSTANETDDDPTIRRVMAMAKSWGYGGVYIANCWAYVTSDPKLLKFNELSDRWNNDMLTVSAGECKDVVFAWGSFKIVSETGRDKELIEMFPNAKALHINKNGSPKHPLYCKTDTKLISFHPLN